MKIMREQIHNFMKTGRFQNFQPKIDDVLGGDNLFAAYIQSCKDEVDRHRN